jgi:NAD(P)H dehydrogenase (quinone)
MHAPPKPDYPVIAAADLTKYDGIIFGVPTRYGSMPAQVKVRI